MTPKPEPIESEVTQDQDQEHLIPLSKGHGQERPAFPDGIPGVDTLAVALCVADILSDPAREPEYQAFLEAVALRVADILSNDNRQPGLRFMNGLYNHVVDSVWGNRFENNIEDQVADSLSDSKCGV
jgi:hypothetical protein